MAKSFVYEIFFITKQAHTHKKPAFKRQKYAFALSSLSIGHDWRNPETNKNYFILVPLTMNATSSQTSGSTRLEMRRSPNNPNHHLWWNNGTWWCHITLRPAGGSTIRKRFSLKTNDIEVARTRRDRIIHAIQISNVGL
jgi:hypothetical protein